MVALIQFSIGNPRGLRADPYISRLESRRTRPGKHFQTGPVWCCRLLPACRAGLAPVFLGAGTIPRPSFATAKVRPPARLAGTQKFGEKQPHAKVGIGLAAPHYRKISSGLGGWVPAAVFEDRPPNHPLTPFLIHEYMIH